VSPEDERLPHIPVLLAEVLRAIEPRQGEVYVDGTFGAGGYSRALLEAADCRVLALDRDPTAAAAAARLAAEFPARFTFIETTFGRLEAVVREHVEDGLVDAVVLDLGVSSMQIDDASRGFSFMADGPLDMRMGAEGPTAGDLVNTLTEAELAHVIRDFGEERQALRIARAIVRERKRAPLATTRQLAALIERTLGRPRARDKHPATRTFQALRIQVNDELGELARALVGAERILRTGGRLAVVTFHSLEDRIVKRFLGRRSGRYAGSSRHGPPPPAEQEAPSFRIVNHAPLTPSQRELEANPRARSAKLRIARRTDAPAFPPEAAIELGMPEPGRGRRS